MRISVCHCGLIGATAFAVNGCGAQTFAIPGAPACTAQPPVELRKPASAICGAQRTHLSDCSPQTISARLLFAETEIRINVPKGVVPSRTDKKRISHEDLRRGGYLAHQQDRLFLSRQGDSHHPRSRRSYEKVLAGSLQILLPSPRCVPRHLRVQSVLGCMHLHCRSRSEQRFLWSTIHAPTRRKFPQRRLHLRRTTHPFSSSPAFYGAFQLFRLLASSASQTFSCCW